MNVLHAHGDDESWHRPGGPESLQPPRPLLRLLIPLALIVVSTALGAGFLAVLVENQLAVGREVMTTRLRDNLVQLQDRLAGHREKEAARTQLQMVAALSPFEEVAILDGDFRVAVAARHRDDGLEAAGLAGFDAGVARRAMEAGVLLIDPKPELRRMAGYVPLVDANGSTRTGAPRFLLYGSLDLSVDRARLEAVIGNLALRAGAMMLTMSLLLVLTLNGFVVRRLARVKAAMADFAHGDLTSRSPLAWRDEIGSVGESFNAMAERLELEYRRILESRERYQQVVEGSSDLVYVVDADGRILFVNSASRTILGREPEEVLGHNAFEYVEPADRDAVFAWHEAFRDSNDDRSTMKFRILHLDGSRKDLFVNSRKVRGADGRLLRIEVIARDMSALVAAETEQEKERRRFEALFQGARDGIVLCDAGDGSILGVNRAAEALVEVGQESILGRHYTTFVPEEAVNVLRGGEPLVRTQVTRPDGATVPVEMSASRVQLPDGTEVDQVNLRDLRERQQFEERLMHAEKMGVVGQLAGGVAHDFNNQLAGILGYAELLAMRLPAGPLHDYADRIQTAAQRSADLTRQLLAFSRKGRLAQDPVDLHALLREVASVLERSVDPRIRVRVEPGAREPVVLGDATQLQNALLNLGVNARDAMPDGGDLVFATCDAQDAEAGAAHPGWVEVTVSDTGTGMDAATLAHAFEPFFTTKPVGSGTGMGLAAVYGTITGHGGTIELASRPGAGTTCTIRLPLVEATTVVEAAPAGGPEQQARPRRHEVLVVDDEEPVRQLMAELLSSGGYEAVTCSGGRAALEQVQRDPQRFDLVLLDLRMPDLSGEETMARLKVLRSDLPVLLMSGYAPDETARKLRREGARGLLRKPCSRAELLEAVRRAVSGED